MSLNSFKAIQKRHQCQTISMPIFVTVLRNILNLHLSKFIDNLAATSIVGQH